jgi:hypothetical protein
VDAVTATFAAELMREGFRTRTHINIHVEYTTNIDAVYMLIKSRKYGSSARESKWRSQQLMFSPTNRAALSMP